MEELFLQPWSKRINFLFYLRCGCFLELLRRETGNYSHLLHDVPEEALLQEDEPADEKGRELSELKDESGGSGVQDFNQDQNQNSTLL